ncbi:putative quinol monooxygenase [Nocardia sp. NPDC059239]|uniref:putative quinol monooxygenase n=1 Tax=Nocardia sp. NPDC059239 TaxID=3346785 RepID=UPI00369DB252
MTVVVTAIFNPLPGRKGELIEAMRPGIAAVHEEPGCELYSIHDAEDGTVTMLEKWTSQADLDAHAHGAAVALLNKDIKGLLAEPVRVTTMSPIPAGTPSQGNL